MTPLLLIFLARALAFGIIGGGGRGDTLYAGAGTAYPHTAALSALEFAPATMSVDMTWLRTALPQISGMTIRLAPWIEKSSAEIGASRNGKVKKKGGVGVGEHEARTKRSRSPQAPPPPAVRHRVVQTVAAPALLSDREGIASTKETTSNNALGLADSQLSDATPSRLFAPRRAAP